MVMVFEHGKYEIVGIYTLGKYMKKNFLLLILFAIFVVSFITFLLIFNYLDPYENRIIALVSMLIASFFSFTTLVTLLLYGFKKIYYR